jgi:hypothetical protein
MQISAGTSLRIEIPAGSRLVLSGAGEVQTVPPTNEPTRRITVQGTTVGPFGNAAAVIVSASQAVTARLLSPDAVFDGDGDPLPRWRLAADGSASLLRPDDAVVALSEASPVVTLTATGTAFTGACEFRGINVRAISGTPQTVTVYDATSATGTPIAVFTVSAIGYYYWDGDMTTPGVGTGARRVNSTGCHVVISGGTSRTIDVDVRGA